MSEPQKIGEILQTSQMFHTLSSEEAMNNLTYICPDCGKKNKPFSFDWLGKTVWKKSTCPCVYERLQQEEEKEKLLEKQNRIEKLFKLSQLGNKFSKATFATWEDTAGTQLMYQEAVGFIKEERWKKGEGLLFFGKPGNGKSHIAAAIVNELIPKGIPAIFQIVPDLLLKFKRTYNINSNIDEAGIIETMLQADLVVLDDLGSERLTDWTLEKIFEVVNSLYSHEKSLIVTTNMDIETELEDRIGSRTYDRIIEMCRLVENKGTSYRRKIAEKRLQEAINQ